MSAMKVFGISAVRNEADIIGLAVLHHLRLGLDRILVMDNGSTDGTGEILQRIAGADPRLRWFCDDRAFDQAGMATELAREAQRQGADWVVPFDADEFWWAAEGASFRDVLEGSDAGSLCTVPLNFIQARRQREAAPDAAARAVYRAYETVPMGNLARQLMESHEIGMFQVAYLRKHVLRPTEGVEIERGNHAVRGVRGETRMDENLLCLHLPLRSRALLESKTERSRRLIEAGITGGAWRVWYWARELSRGNLEKEWAANSSRNGRLDVYGESYELLFDPRLRNVLQPVMEEWMKLYEEVFSIGRASL